MDQKEKKTSYKWLAVGVAGIALLAAVAYIWNFWSWPPSGKTEDWANFATYISGTVGVAAVVATLMAFVITLRQQNRLIESQERLLLKQDEQIDQVREQLSLESRRERDERNKILKQERYASVYLLHHFVLLKKFYLSSIEAVQNLDQRLWHRLSRETPDIYPKLLMEDSSEMLLLIEKLETEMATDFVNAVSQAKILANFFKSHLSERAVVSENSTQVGNEIKNIDSKALNDAQKTALDGDFYCTKFLDKANAKFELIRDESNINRLDFD